nr:hypothetical protein [Paludibacterium denitrificans]
MLVDFIEGDIDRPVIVGVLYNGSHATPAFSGAGALLKPTRPCPASSRKNIRVGNTTNCCSTTPRRSAGQTQQRIRQDPAQPGLSDPAAHERQSPAAR